MKIDNEVENNLSNKWIHCKSTIIIINIALVNHIFVVVVADAMIACF